MPGSGLAEAEAEQFATAAAKKSQLAARRKAKWAAEPLTAGLARNGCSLPLSLPPWAFCSGASRPVLLQQQ